MTHDPLAPREAGPLDLPGPGETPRGTRYWRLPCSSSRCCRRWCVARSRPRSWAARSAGFRSLALLGRMPLAVLGLAARPGRSRRRVTAALVLAAWVLGTGALHLDGFLDSCDGLFGGHTPEARLRIIRDERAGAFAVIGGILLLLLKYAALAGNPDPLAALVVAPVLGRWGMAVAVVCFPYGRAEGLGRAMKDHAGWPQAVFASLLTGAIVAGVVIFGSSGWCASPGDAAGAGAVPGPCAVSSFAACRDSRATSTVLSASCWRSRPCCSSSTGGPHAA